MLVPAVGVSLAASACLAASISNEAPPRSDAAAAKLAWQTKFALIDRDAPSDQFLAQADRLIGFVPHVAQGWQSSVGGSLGCEGWSGRFVELDEHWTLVREAKSTTAGVPTIVTLPAPESPSAVRLVGISDLRASIDPPVYETLLDIHRSPVVFGEFDPVNLIRAVNRLQSMGEAKAVEALKAYDKLCMDNPCKVWHHLDSERIVWITRLLWVPKTATSPQMRPPRLGAPLECIDEDSNFQAVYPLVLQDDIPFCAISGYILGGLPEDPMCYLESCRAEGQFRAKPLSPTSDPIRAAEDLITSGITAHMHSWGNPPSRLAEFERANVAGRIRAEALSAAGNVLGSPRQWTDLQKGDDLTEDDWTEITAKAKKLKTLWDPVLADFKATQEKPN
jgi:hypothetical protein